MNDEVELRTAFTPAEARARLLRSLVPPTLGERFIATKVRLAGQVDEDSLLLFRSRGGKPGLLRLEGVIDADPQGAVVRGWLVRPAPSLRFSSLIVFSITLAAWMLADAVMKGSRPELLAAVVAALVLCAVPVAAWRFRELNLRAERDLLLAEITKVLRRAG